MQSDSASDGNQIKVIGDIRIFELGMVYVHVYIRKDKKNMGK